MPLSRQTAASPLQTEMLIPYQRPRTEEIPTNIDIWQATSARNIKTEPHLPFQDVSPNSFRGTDPESHNDIEILPDYPSLPTDGALARPVFGIDELEDPESDISSASGQSASLVSTPASKEAELAQDNSVHLSNGPEEYGNPSYVSRMRMSEFHQEQSRVDWTSLGQTVVATLLGRPRPESEYFQLIGDGGSSFVYAMAFKGRISNDTLAVKVLRKGKPCDTVDLPNELKIMRHLKHNHIVAFVSPIALGNKVGVLLYPLARCNLAQYLKDTSENHLSFQRPEAAHTKTLSKALGCLSSAVMYLHVLKVKHKDIKPENILLDEYGSVLLADFGISKKYEYPDNTVTDGPTPCTKKYAPPEVVDQNKRDLSADIFSLGCVFVEVVTVLLGQSLKNLNDYIFDGRGSDRHNYSQSLLKVGNWICRLKEITDCENFPTHSSSAGVGSTGDDGNIARDQPLAKWHLDVILRMVSEVPEERPSIIILYDLFKSFASGCSECQASNNHSEQGQRCGSGTRFVIKAAPLAESRAVSDVHQPSILHSNFKALRSQDKDKEKGSYEDGLSGMVTMERHLELVLDKDDSDYSSEAESSDSDSSTLDDHEREVNFESADLFSGIRIMTRRMLEINGFDPFLLKTKDSEPGAFNCNPGEGSTSTRRQGSPMEGLPTKRRSTGRGKTLQLSESDGQGDNEENPGDGHGKSEGKGKANGSLRSGRPFACHFYQRDPDRYTSRACRESLYDKYSRVKEHLGRVHRIYRCPRCQEAFLLENEVHQHSREATACEVRDRIFDDNYDWGQGFDDVQSMELRSRQRGVNDEEKWRRDYRVLFPRDEDVPSPYRTDQTAKFMSSLQANVSHRVSSRLSTIIPQHEWPLVQPLVERAIQAGFDDFHKSQQARDRSLTEQLPNLTTTSSIGPQTPAEINDLASEVNEYLEVELCAVQSEPNYDYSFSSEQSQTGIQQGDRANITNDSAYYTTGMDSQDDFYNQLLDFQSGDDILPSGSQVYSGSSGIS